MANTFQNIRPGGGGGVTSLNSATGDLTIVAGTGITVTTLGTNITVSATGGGGTVTSVALALPVSVFTVTGSPVTTSGTLTGSFASQTANTFFAAPNGSAGTPSFRSIVAADVPTLNQNTTGTASNITATSNSTLTTLTVLSLPFSQITGIVPIAQGGTNNSTAYTAGSVIFSNGTSLTQDNANFFWNDTNFSLGISTNTPASNAFIDGINSSGATKRIQVTGYGNNVGFRGKYANGTLGSPTAAVNTNVLAFLSAQGYGATGFSAASTALINMTAAGTFTDSSMPTDVNILTTPTGSITAVQTALFSHTGAVTLGATSSTAIHQINGGINRTIRTITANLTVDTTTTDDIIYCNASGAITVTLPAPTAGRVLTIKDISGNATTNNITIARHASETIEGLASSYVIQVSYENVIISSDGANWWILG